MTDRRSALAAALGLLVACSAPAGDSAAETLPAAADQAISQRQSPPPVDTRLADIERRAGGRLGVALIDEQGYTLLAHREGERFAMCSTFKLPLASMVLDGAEQGRWRLDERLPLTRQDLLNNSSVSERHVAAGHITLEQAAAAIVTVSDNAAANLVLRRVGGPAAFTQWLRDNGDQETRLDREEMALNENSPGDPRDTSTPRAYAAMMARIVGPQIHDADNQQRLRAWTTASRTGTRRIRAGLPAGWTAGDKTGTCGTAWNDIAWFRTPGGRNYVLAIFLDRPTVRGAEAEAVLAEVARLAVPLAR
jgi:beta-lactamase class A